MKPSNTKRVGQAITLALIGICIFTFAYGYTYHAKLENQNIEVRQQLEQRQQEIKQLIDTKQQNEAELKQELERLNKELQAKKERESRALAEKAVKKPSMSVTGTKADWLKASNIPQSEWWAVDFIVSKESSWNPNAINKSSGACSLAQALPCSKIPGNWRDPVNALNWQYSYVKARYGGYPQAVAFWKANSWY